jgi:PHD/YefM family antitoxin component YafN of YafNO toxin-antitoxin module
MKVYTYSEARQRLANVLNIAKTEEVVIKRIISC